MNAIISIIISMLSSLLFVTEGDGYNDSVAWQSLEEVRTGLIALDKAGDDQEKVEDATREVYTGVIRLMERREQLRGKFKELDCSDYERFEAAGKYLAERYLEFLKLRKENNWNEEYTAGLFGLQMRDVLKKLMSKHEWEDYGSIPGK